MVVITVGDKRKMEKLPTRGFAVGIRSCCGDPVSEVSEGGRVSGLCVCVLCAVCVYSRVFGGKGGERRRTPPVTLSDPIKSPFD